MDSFGQFLNDAGRITLLTPEEEIYLGKQVQAMRALLEDKPKGPYGKNQKATLRRGQRAKERMVSANLRLVVMISRKYLSKNRHVGTAARGIAIEDLVQEGNMGLMRAVDKFDPTRGYKFSTYAFWWIKQGITRYLHQKTRMIRPPHHIAEKIFQINKVTHHLCNTLGRRPTLDELAEGLGMSRNEFDLMRERAAGVTSLDQLAVEDGSSLITLIGAGTNEQQLNDLHQSMHLAKLSDCIDRLEAKERHMIVMRYGLEGHHPHSYREIGEIYNLSRERVRQYVEKGQRKLRFYLSSQSSLAPDAEQPLYRPWTLAGAA
jgi:RNA polymerase primary sigma factor